MAGRQRVAAVLLAGLLVAGLGGCKPKPAENEPRSANAAVDIVELPHGTLPARPGSPEEAMARFLEADGGGTRTFRFDADEFAPWSDKMSVQTQGTLSSIILVLQAYPTAKLAIAAFTDSEGSEAANRDLSQRRVDGLKKLMVTRGIDADRIKVAAMEASAPIASNDTAAGRALNRRVEITVTKVESAAS